MILLLGKILKQVLRVVENLHSNTSKDGVKLIETDFTIKEEKTITNIVNFKK